MADEPNKNGAASGDGGDETKVEFTPKQQEKVQELIDKAVGRVANNVRDEFTGQVKTLTAQLETARAALKSATTPAEKKESKEDIAALQAKIEEMQNASKTSTADIERYKGIAQAKEKELEAAKADALNVRKEVAITSAATKSAEWVDLDVVRKLTQETIHYEPEKGKWVVLNEKGQPRLNAAMEEMSLAEFFNDFAAKNPYLVKSSIKQGVGSTEASRSALSRSGKFEVSQIFGKASNSALASKLMKEDPAEYRRLKVIAKEAGLLA
jgi:hypothetical protein